MEPTRHCPLGATSSDLSAIVAISESLGQIESSASRRLRRETLDDLTPREREVFNAIAAGLSNAELGARLHLTEDREDAHHARAHELGLRDRVQVVIPAYDHGLR